MFHQFQFGEFRLDTEEEYLYQGNVKINISRRAVQTLRLLVANPNKIITKHDFFDTVWADSFVEEANLSVAIAAIRKVLGDDPKHPKFIENLPRKGYRFIGDVRKIEKSENVSVAFVKDTNTAVKTNSDTESGLKAARRKFSPKSKISIALASILAIFAVIFGIGYQNFSKSDPVTSIAVLPFDNQIEEIEFVSDGLAEAVASNLAEFSSLRVISRNSTFQYKNKKPDAITVGRELNVSAVLTGKIVKLGDRIIVKIELTDAAANRLLWSKEYEKTIEDALTLQKEMVSDISVNINPALQQNRLTTRGTDNSEAYLLYLKGRYHWNKRTDVGNKKALEYFQQSLDNDPTFALAYVGLANCYSRIQWMPEKTVKEKTNIIEGAALKALELDPNLGEAHAVIALNRTYHGWNMKSAAEHFRRAIELSPQYSTGHHWYAEFLAMQGRFEESFREYDAALALDPLSFAIMSDRAFNYYYAEKYDQAIEELKKIEQISPDFQRTYYYLYFVYQEKAMFEEAHTVLGKLHALQNAAGDLSADRLAEYKLFSEKSLTALRESGVDAYWQSRFDFELFDNNRVPPGMGFARIYAKLDNFDKAFEYLERDIQYGAAGINWMKVSPEWKRLRSDPRFNDMLKRIGLEGENL
ncbi:MAG TPA: winged helix-turn-helix domain-containing protein [Pyrinomonadaceae bacterium]|nr:winged helix-turn-helix domain-containing protein [Pyrinomonadaceae bacterium]